MSEDRNQAPTRRRRQEARERGLVARSPELTAAAGLLAAVVLLGVWGGDLAAALVALVRAPLFEEPVLSADLGEVVWRVRHLAAAVAVPSGIILGGAALAMVAAHQAQVGGLWVPGLLAPDPRRLWPWGEDEAGAGLGARAARGAGALAKAAVVVAAAAWAVGAHRGALERLGRLETAELARLAGLLLRDLGLALAAATLGLGLLDLLVQHRRLEALLYLTPREQREDLRATDGDPALRARRRRLAQAWHLDPAHALAGISLVLTGPDGLTVLVAGGPPPRRLAVRLAAQGPPGLRLRQAADRAQLPRVEADDLARRLARRRPLGRPLPAELLEGLAEVWPARPAHA